jgi:hypothetical protein
MQLQGCQVFDEMKAPTGKLSVPPTNKKWLPTLYYFFNIAI